MNKIIRFPDGTWTYSNTEGELYGQHVIGYGACDFVRYYLIGKFEVALIRNIREKKLLEVYHGK